MGKYGLRNQRVQLQTCIHSYLLEWLLAGHLTSLELSFLIWKYVIGLDISEDFQLWNSTILYNSLHLIYGGKVKKGLNRSRGQKRVRIQWTKLLTYTYGKRNWLFCLSCLNHNLAEILFHMASLVPGSGIPMGLVFW